MSTYAYRFVAQEKLPSRLSDFDLDTFFRLTGEDVAAIRDQFRSDHRAPAALMVLFLRAAGRPLDRTTVLPRNLLRYVGTTLNTAAPTIASLRSIYQRSQTLYKHQLWAKNYLGLKDLDDAAETELVAILALQAREASHPDDLVTAACHWLYERKILIPGERRVQDWARAAFASIEAEILQTIEAAVSASARKACHKSVYSSRSDGLTHLEWLKTPSKRHGPTTLAETLTKIRYLKSLGVHEWALDTIALPKQRAYAQQVQARRPAKSRELKESTQTIELVCFLRISLLELSDVAMHQANRRSQQLFREAAQNARSSQTRSATSFVQRALKVKAVLHDGSKTWRDRVLEGQRLLADLTETSGASFVSHVRRALAEDSQRVHAFLAGVHDLDFGGRSDDAGFQRWQAWHELHGVKATEFPAGFTIPEVGAPWHDLVHDADRRRGFKAFEACTMMSLRKSLRGGSVWLDHSLSFRERDQMLIPRDEWERDKAQILAMLKLPATADEYLEPLLANLQVGVAAVAEAHAKGKVEIGDDGMLHLPQLTARPDDGEPRRTREAIYKVIGDVQFPDLLLDIDALCNFSEVLLGHRAETVAELLALYAALLAHGTDIDAKGVAAMIPGLDAARVSVAMRALEMPGRLRRANERVAEFQGRIPIAAHWGTGEKASADMMSVDASRHLWNARVDPRRRTYAAGIYTHLLDRWGIIYDHPIVLNERQAGVAVEGVEQHNRSQDRIRLSLLAVDTHGYTNPGMAVAKGLGFDLCPRLRDLAERKLYLPAKFLVPEGLERITIKRISLRAIRVGWDEFLRLLASIRLGRISAELALQRWLGSGARKDPAHKAAEHLGRLLRSIFLCDYVTIEDFRREIHTLLSRGESVHQLQRAVYSGKVSDDRGRRRDEMKAISGAHALLTNIVLAWNTHRMNDVVERLRRDGVQIDDAWLRRIGPANFGHINFRGTFSFAIDKYAEAVLRSTETGRRAGAN